MTRGKLYKLLFFPQFQVDVEGDFEYEFPCYNGMEAPEGIWTNKKSNLKDTIYGGVLLKSSGLSPSRPSENLLKIMLPRIQTHLRKQFVQKGETSSDLFQWSKGSKYFIGDVEAILWLVEASSGLEVRVRGPKNHEKECFFFLEEILGVIDQV